MARVAGLDVDINRISDIPTDIGRMVAGGGNVKVRRNRAELASGLERAIATWSRRSPDWSATTRFRSPCRPAPVEGLVEALTPDQQRRRRVADELAEFGMVESLSYPFVGDDDYKAFGFDPKPPRRSASRSPTRSTATVRTCVARFCRPWPPPCSATSAAASKTWPL